MRRMKSLCSLLAALVWVASSWAGELQEAAGQGDVAKVRALLQANPNALNARDGGTTALHEAARAGHLAVVQLLVEKGANLNAPDFSGLTPLKLALGRRQTQVTDYLRQQGALERTVAGPHAVVATNAPAGTRPIFGTGSAPKIVTPNPGPVRPPGRTPPPETPPTERELLAVTIPIHDAARAGNLEQIKQLFASAPYLVDATDEKGLTPLHVAAANQQYATAQLLLILRAAVNAQSFTGQTPLHVAARHGDLTMGELLLTNRAPVNARDKFGNTPLLTALQTAQGDVVEKQTTLLNPKGINVSVLAAQQQQLNFVRLLLASRADVNVRNTDGITPLIGAVSLGNEPVVNALLKAQADANTADGAGLTPLHLAAGRGQAAITDTLIRHRAGLNTPDGRGETPLGHALRAGHTNTIALLRRAGATTGQMRPLNATEQSLVDFYQRTELTLTRGSAAEKSRTLIALNPTEADTKRMFPRHAATAWKVVEDLNRQIKQAFSRSLPDADLGKEIWRIRPEPPGLAAQEWRERLWLAPELPVLSLAVEKTGGTTRPGDYCFVHGHWVILPPLRAIAAQQAAADRAAGR